MLVSFDIKYTCVLGTTKNSVGRVELDKQELPFLYVTFHHDLAPRL